MKFGRLDLAWIFQLISRLSLFPTYIKKYIAYLKHQFLKHALYFYINKGPTWCLYKIQINILILQSRTLCQF